MSAVLPEPETARGPGVLAAGLTHPGLVRDHNEDAWTMVPDHGLYVVSDGMGGHASGETASRVVVEALPGLLGGRLGAGPMAEGELHELLRSTLVALSLSVRRQALRRVGLGGMGATVVVAVIGGDRVTVAHLGDSRAYRQRAGALEALTADHSVVGILLRRGEIRPGEAAGHPARGQITRYVGMDAAVNPDVTSVDLLPGDRLLLCTDGLAGVIPDEQIGTLVAAATTPEEACRRLVDAALAGGGPDNVTVLVVERSVVDGPAGDRRDPPEEG